jgi:hypothetical protein
MTHPRTPARYAVGSRVEDVERPGLAKVIGCFHDPETDAWEYELRAFAHPHPIWRTDDPHLGPPRGKTHDPRAGRNTPG